jgi:hypothetical protein
VTTIALSFVLFVTACTAQPATREPVPTSSPNPTAAIDESAEANATLQAFSTAVFEERLDDAVQYVSPGSVAERYLTHQQALETGFNANGEGQSDPADRPTLTFSDGVATITYVDSEPYTWDDFAFDEDGLVRSWTGKSGPIADTLWTQPWTGQSGGNTIDLVSAYRSSSGSLFVILKVTANEGATSPFAYSATYSASDGITYSVESASQPQDIAAGSAGYVIMTFSGAPFGGTVNFDGSSPDDYSVSWNASIPIA